MAGEEEVGVKLTAVDAAAVISTLNEVKEVLQKTGQQAQESSSQVDKSGQVMTGALRRVGEIGVNALLAAGQAFVGFMKDQVNAAADYEGSMNMLQAVTGATGDQMKQAGELAQKLGADLDLPATSAADAGKAMTELAKAGLSVDQAMAAAKGTLQLAAAGGLDEAKAAEIAANALNVFGLEGSKVTDVANLLANAANASSLEVTDAADAFRQAGSVYSQFQGQVVGSEQAMKDMTTVIALLGNAGIKGSDAGTSLKQTLLQLAAPSDKAKGLMKDLAESIGESGDIAYDANGNMRPFRDIIELTAKSTAGLTQEQAQYKIATIFGADATRTVLSLIKAGPEAWDKMSDAVGRAGGAQQLASARMQGFGGAVQGLQSQLETLALEAILPLLPPMTELVSKAAEIAGSFAGSIGPAIQGAIDVMITAGGIIQTIFVPALVGATAATIAFAIANGEQLLASLTGMIAKLALATTGFIAHAAAVALAALPYAAIAAAAAVVVIKFNELNDKIKSAGQSLLESKPFWQDSTKSLENFAAAAPEVQAKYQGVADAVNANRKALSDEVEALGRRMTLGQISQEEYNSEMEAINRQAVAVQASSKQLDELVAAELRTQAASATATQKLNTMTDAHGDLQQATELSAKDIDKLMKAIDKNYDDGAKAVDAYVNTSVDFYDKLAKAMKQTGDDQQKSLEELAAAYAKAAAEQKAHLGALLSDYVTAQVQLGNISQEKGGQILDGITKQFGTTESVAAKAYLQMTADIDKFAKESGTSADDFAKHLDDLGQNAVDTKQEMDALAKKYEAELIQNFKAGKIDADELKAALEKIPEKVYSEVTITHRDIYEEEHRKSEHEGKQHGGPVVAGQAYVVGEQRPEVFEPKQSGTVYPSIDAYRRQGKPLSPANIINLTVPPPQIVMVQPSNQQNYYGQVGNNYTQSMSKAQRDISPWAAASLYGGRG